MFDTGPLESCVFLSTNFPRRDSTLNTSILQIVIFLLHYSCEQLSEAWDLISKVLIGKISDVPGNVGLANCYHGVKGLQALRDE